MKKMRNFLVLVIFIYLNLVKAEPYNSLSSMCDGFPQILVSTTENICVGLVIQKNATNPLKKPRTLIELDQKKLLVIDAGSWMPNQGSLLLVDYSKTIPVTKILLSKLNLPHRILVGPNNKIYFSEANKISRFRWKNNEINNLETVIDALPFTTRYLHPLKNFIFDLNGDLIVNIGSSSDRCEEFSKSCIDGTEASLRRYIYNPTTDQFNSQYSIIATGLRNSMALAVHSSGTLIQAENSIDLPDAEEPYEELNVIENNRFYGWPYCYNASMTFSGNSCSYENYQPPWTLLPPHVAPLDMIYYQGNKIPALKNKLIMSWHGFRIAGNRLVAYELDSQGKPLLKPTANFRRAPADGKSAYTQHIFSAKGGLNKQDSNHSEQVAQHQEIISEWHPIEGVRPEGSPVGLTQAKDGSLWIADDRNSAILRLSSGKSFDSKQLNELSKKTVPSDLSLPKEISYILNQHCSQCHKELNNNPGALFNAAHWLKQEQGVFTVEFKLFIDEARPMPPANNLSDIEKHQLKTWLAQLRKNS